MKHLKERGKPNWEGNNLLDHQNQSLVLNLSNTAQMNSPVSVLVRAA